jgi:hypothetical protein
MRRLLQHALGINLIAVAVMGLVAAAGWWRGGTRETVPDDLTVDQLVDRLHARGVQVRAVPAMENGPLNGGAFLTTSDRSWKQLNRLQLVPDRISDWQDTVYTARIGPRPAGNDWLWQWGDCADHIGAFVFFGDAALRARIKEAMREPSGKTTASETPPVLRLEHQFVAD